MRPDSPSKCPLLHTQLMAVCRYGQHVEYIARHVSVSAHVDPGRAQKRTLPAAFRPPRVRLRTTDKRPCAKADTYRVASPRTRPFLHTPILAVCKSGHFQPHFARHVSDFAHQTSARVQKRTPPASHRPARVRFCTRRSWPRAKADATVFELFRNRPRGCASRYAQQTPSALPDDVSSGHT
jgi:hypothetical protein